MKSNVKSLFLDIGGVLGTNGWDHPIRSKVAEKFDIDFNELNERHDLTFDTYEQGKFPLDEYLNRVVFFKKRPFSIEEFKKSMLAESKLYPENFEFFCSLKKQFDLKVVAVSNEGKELHTYRVKAFNLNRLMDFYIMSFSLHLRKPDLDLFQVALESTQLQPDEVVYVDDRKMFVDVAEKLGIHGIHHENLSSTRNKFSDFGLTVSTMKNDVLLRSAT